MKNLLCIVLCLCSVLLACKKENPKMPAGRRDPVDLLNALPAATGAERAAVLEELGLTKDAIYAWNEAARTHPERSQEARQALERLQHVPDPLRLWSTAAVDAALRRRDGPALTKLASVFPDEAARYFEKCDFNDRESARLFAKALAAAGEHYPEAVIDAMDRSKDRKALDAGLAAFRDGHYKDASTLLEKAGNPLFLTARYYEASNGSLPILDTALSHLKPDYRELSARIHIYRASLLENEDRYLEAHADYAKARVLAHEQPSSTASSLARESWNFAAIGEPAKAFRYALDALKLLPRVADMDARNHAYAGAANAAAQLGHPDIALRYQNAAVENTQRGVTAALPKYLGYAKLELAVALRARAEIRLQLGQDAGAEGDLRQAAELAEAAERNDVRDLLRMRRLDVQGQAALKHRPAEAVTAFSDAIALAKGQDSTYRATLHFKRAEARRAAGDAHADDDIATAMQILRNEVRGALADQPDAASEPLWTPYFLRFREQHHELIESRITAGDFDGALFYAEFARAFEPMQILLQEDALPRGFRFPETKDDLQRACAALPEDTVILEYLVLPEHTYTWVVTRERIQLVRQRATKDDIQRWVNDVQAIVTKFRQNDPFTRATRAAYAELFREPLRLAGAGKTRIVIVPDEPMQGLPFNALGTAGEGYLIERANTSIATAGSLSLYLYALARDRELSSDRHPTALLVDAPAFAGFARLPYAREEVQRLSRDYEPHAETLTDSAATVSRFLTEAKRATVIHFAGHALASPQMPWQSRLLLASDGKESGELTAQELMRKLPRLTRTRLVVLGACSTAGGGSVGPQGLAPLVRPLIAARVPAVVGSLWDVADDASTQQLLVFLHCHYRHGDDVAVALRNAQLERLRKKQPARVWAAFQVVGYAASPYPRSLALEDTSSEHVCNENLLLRPHGLHPQPERDRSHGPAAQ